MLRRRTLFRGAPLLFWGRFCFGVVFPWALLSRVRWDCAGCMYLLRGGANVDAPDGETAPGGGECGEGKSGRQPMVIVRLSGPVTVIPMVRVSGGRSCSIFSGHSTRQRAPLSKYSSYPRSNASSIRFMR